MRYEEIEHHLGPELATAIRDSVQAAYVAAASSPDAQEKLNALQWHLIAMLSAMIINSGSQDTWRSTATECARRLTNIIDEVWLSGHASRDIAPGSWRRQ